MQCYNRLILFLLVVFFSLSACQTELAAAAPYAPSKIIDDVTFDSSTQKRMANGSDNWPITWADDGHQYTAWGDGWGFAEKGDKQSLGFSRVEGSFEKYSAKDVWGDSRYASNPSQFGGKSYGIISIDGVLYAWWGPGSTTASYRETRLLKSTNHGAFWEKSSWDFTDTDNTLIMPTICNFGRDYSGAKDGYVYHYFIRKQGNPSSLNVHKPGKIDLARVPKGSMMIRSAYEFFAGRDSNGNPIWTTNAKNRVPVFEDPNGVGWNASVSYNNGLGRYILITEHTATCKGNLGMFDAPEPWGPWTTVGYYSNWLNSGTTFFWNFANKWLSSDGKHFTLVFSGIEAYDSWNSIRGTFITSGEVKADPAPPDPRNGR